MAPAPQPGLMMKKWGRGGSGCHSFQQTAEMLRKKQEAEEETAAQKPQPRMEAEGLVQVSGVGRVFAPLSSPTPFPSKSLSFPSPVFPYLSKKSQTGDLRNLF